MLNVLTREQQKNGCIILQFLWWDNAAGRTFTSNEHITHEAWQQHKRLQCNQFIRNAKFTSALCSRRQKLISSTQMLQRISDIVQSARWESDNLRTETIINAIPAMISTFPSRMSNDTTECVLLVYSCAITIHPPKPLFFLNTVFNCNPLLLNPLLQSPAIISVFVAQSTHSTVLMETS